MFFTDVRVGAENLVGPLNQGWRVANGSLGHERTMMWLGFADRLDNMIADFHPRPRWNATSTPPRSWTIWRCALLGSVALARAARGEEDTAPRCRCSSCSVPKRSDKHARHALIAAGSDGLIHPALTGPYAQMNLDHYFASWFERYARSFCGHHRRRHLRNPAQHHRAASARTTRQLSSPGGERALAANLVAIFRCSFSRVSSRPGPSRWPGEKVAGRCPHALDDADGFVVNGAVGVASIVGQSVEHGGEHGLEHVACHVRADAAMNADAKAEVPVTFTV